MLSNPLPPEQASIFVLLFFFAVLSAALFLALYVSNRKSRVVSKQELQVVSEKADRIEAQLTARIRHIDMRIEKLIEQFDDRIASLEKTIQTGFTSFAETNGKIEGYLKGLAENNNKQ